jgi:hypothetical protein
MVRQKRRPVRWRTEHVFFILLFVREAPKVYPQYILGAVMNLATKIFFLPGDIVSDLLGATKADDRMMIRMFVDMLFWSFVVIIGAWVVFR